MGVQVFIHHTQVWEIIFHVPVLLKVLVKLEELYLVAAATLVAMVLYQFVGETSPLSESLHLLYGIENPEYLHRIDNTDALHTLSIVRSQEHRKQHTLEPIHSQILPNPIYRIEFYIVLEDSSIDVPSSEQENITVLSHNTLYQPFLLQLRAL